MDFKKAAILGSYISKDYAEDLFRLLATYRDISASEAASRLDMHIRTVQDFFEAMASLDILEKKEVFEKKRPYYRYALKTNRIRMEIDLLPLIKKQEQPVGKLSKSIREKKNAGARFTTARNNQYISSVIIWTGEGRQQNERKINLSIPQGKFLFNLPFPGADFLSIAEIMERAGVEEMNISEILDIVEELMKYGVIEENRD
jgi:hypothetical protein